MPGLFAGFHGRQRIQNRFRGWWRERIWGERRIGFPFRWPERDEGFTKRHCSGNDRSSPRNRRGHRDRLRAGVRVVATFKNRAKRFMFDARDRPRGGVRVIAAVKEILSESVKPHHHLLGNGWIEIAGFDQGENFSLRSSQPGKPCSQSPINREVTPGAIAVASEELGTAAGAPVKTGS